MGMLAFDHRSSVHWKVVISAVILGMLVNDAHYDLPVLAAPASVQYAAVAAAHYRAVAGGDSIVFEYFVPLFTLGLVVLQLIVLYQKRNLLAAIQTAMFLIGFVVFSVIVSPRLRDVAAGMLSGSTLTDATFVIAVGHLGMMLLLIVSLFIDWRHLLNSPPRA